MELIKVCKIQNEKIRESRFRFIVKIQFILSLWNPALNAIIERNAFNCIYSVVMQSDGNSFCGDVVSDILAQILQRKYVRIIIIMISILYNIIRKCYNNTVTIKPNFVSSLLFLCAVLL